MDEPVYAERTVDEFQKRQEEACRKGTELLPELGGCFFCYRAHDTDEDPLLFSMSFDAFVHKHCILKELDDEWFNPEAQVMAKEFKLV